VGSVADVALMVCRRGAQGLPQVIRDPRMVWPQMYVVVGS
jgi:hypothetical protein